MVSRLLFYPARWRASGRVDGAHLMAAPLLSVFTLHGGAPAGGPTRAPGGRPRLERASQGSLKKNHGLGFDWGINTASPPPHRGPGRAFPRSRARLVLSRHRWLAVVTHTRAGVVAISTSHGSPAPLDPSPRHTYLRPYFLRTTPPHPLMRTTRAHGRGGRSKRVLVGPSICDAAGPRVAARWGAGGGGDQRGGSAERAPRGGNRSRHVGGGGGGGGGRRDCDDRGGGARRRCRRRDDRALGASSAAAITASGVEGGERKTSRSGNNNKAYIPSGEPQMRRLESLDTSNNEAHHAPWPGRSSVGRKRPRPPRRPRLHQSPGRRPLSQLTCGSAHRLPRPPLCNRW